MYKVEFPDGRRETYDANVIVQAIYSPVNHEGTRDMVV